MWANFMVVKLSFKNPRLSCSSIKHFLLYITFNGCPAHDFVFILFLNIVDPDKLASDETIWSESAWFSTQI